MAVHIPHWSTFFDPSELTKWLLNSLQTDALLINGTFIRRSFPGRHTSMQKRPRLWRRQGRGCFREVFEDPFGSVRLKQLRSEDATRNIIHLGPVVQILGESQS